MHVIHSESERLVLKNHSHWMGGVIGLGALLWVVTVMGTAAWGTVNISTQTPPPTYYWLRLVGLVLVFGMGCFFSWVGAVTAVNVWRGVTCAFDRAAEHVIITQPNGLRTHRQKHSIYGVSHAMLEDNAELRTLAVYLVLRSGQRIPLGTYSHFEQAEAERTVNSIRAFLRGR